MALGAGRLLGLCLCQDLCLGGVRGAGPRRDPRQAWQGAGAEAFSPLRTPDCPCPRPRWGGRAPVSLLADALGARSSALGPAAATPTPAPTPLPLPGKKAPRNRPGSGLGNSWGSKMKGWPFPATGHPYATLQPDFSEASPQSRKWTQSREQGFADPCYPAFIRCLHRQTAGLVGRAEARPSLAAAGLGSRRPARDSTEVLSSSVSARPPPQTLPRLPCPGEEGAKS